VLSGNSYDGLSNYGVAAVSSCVLTENLYDGLYSYQGETTVSNSVVSGNSGGGLFNDVNFGPNNLVVGFGSMTVSDSIISDNLGPGIWNYSFLTILNSTLSGNSAGQALDGGGIRSGTFKAPGSVTVINSTISGNSASGGGGGIMIYYGSLSIVKSTISGNSAGGAGGGISSGRVQVTNSTISGNSAAICAGICAEIVEIGNTILNANASGNIDGTVTSRGYNVCSDNGGGLLNGPGDQINTDPVLGPLQDNGGRTFTHLPLLGSPAIDAGDPNFVQPPFHDQRGPCFYRVFGRRIDVSSVETQPRPRCVTPAPRPAKTLFGVSFSDSNIGTAVGGTFGQSEIFRTTDGGEHWIPQANPGTEFLFDVSFTDTNDGTAVGDQGAILRTTDGGKNCVPQASGTTKTLYGVSFTD
jgi:hypothetical protein